MKIHTIYLDMDDVLNTLGPYLLRSFGCSCEATDYGAYPGSLDIVPATNRLLGTRYGRKQFWEAVHQRIWAECPKSPECDWLIRRCRSLVGYNIYIATSPTKDPGCLAGKLEWIHSHLPRWLHRQYCITPRKHLLGKPGTLLIDDNEGNCLKFIDAGGVAILFPRPWNSAAGQPARAFLDTNLEILENQTD
jgi:5'(3')-deoxyribonucleotidase